MTKAVAGATENRRYDLIIVGGGLAGTCAAIALAKIGLSVALVEAVEPQSELSPSFDQRAVALSASSVEILKSLELWPSLSAVACPIEHILVSEQGQFGFARFHAEQQQIKAFGQVLPLEESAPNLWQQLLKQPGVSVYCPQQVDSIKASEHSVTVQLNAIQPDAKVCPSELAEKAQPQSESICAKLLLAADGTYSTIAKRMALGVTRTPYFQHALITNIKTEFAHENRAYERFTKSGPLALLPLSRNRMSLVWCQKPDLIDQMMQCDTEEFMRALQKAFGYRLGKIEKIGKRFQYPLSLHLAEAPYGQRVFLLGNAAHTIHPVAGQGFNLALRDIAALSENIQRAIAGEIDFGSASFLQDFCRSRSDDWQTTVAATDTLARLFSNDFLPLQLARNKALATLNRLPWAKTQLVRAAMGNRGRASRLARGLK